MHTTSTSYPDLFYAMRGAGDSFGIVTYLYLATEAAPATVLSFSSVLSSNINNINTLTTGFQTLQNYTLNSGKITGDLAFGIYIDTDGTMNLQGWCISCAQTTLSTIITGLVAGFKNPRTTITSYNWINALTAISAPAALTQPLGSAYSSHDTFFAKSITTRNAIPLTAAAIRAYFNTIIANQGEGPWFSIISLYGGPSSAINTPSSSSSSYSDRDSLWTIQNYGYSANSQLPYDSAISTIVNDLESSITNAMPNGGFEAYLNYLDPELTPQTAATLYYGKETYNKLFRLKTVYDPLFTFWNPHAVGNSVAL